MSDITFGTLVLFVFWAFYVVIATSILCGYFPWESRVKFWWLKYIPSAGVLVFWWALSKGAGIFTALIIGTVIVFVAHVAGSTIHFQKNEKEEKEKEEKDRR